MSKKSRFRGPFTSNIVNGPKHCSKLNDTTLTMFIDPCEGYSGWESLSELYAKTQDCLFTHWLQRISILFLTEAIYWRFSDAIISETKNIF